MIHKKIKEQIVEAMRAKDTIRLETLRGVNALFLNEMLMNKATPAPGTEFLPDDKALALIKRSVKQHKDSIAQFEIGKRKDLADKERVELGILESFLPQSMSRDQLRPIVEQKIADLKANGKLDLKAGAPQAQLGKLTGMIIKDLAGQADGADVKAVVEEVAAKEK
jgi:uncharacterized protein YqeY